MVTLEYLYKVYEDVNNTAKKRPLILMFVVNPIA